MIKTDCANSAFYWRSVNYVEVKIEGLLTDGCKRISSNNFYLMRWVTDVNLEKCKEMRIRHSLKTSYTTRQDEKVWSLQETTEDKDLSVITTADLKVSRQCCEAASKASRILGIDSKQFKNLNKKCFLILYKVFVRSTWNMSFILGHHT